MMMAQSHKRNYSLQQFFSSLALNVWLCSQLEFAEIKSISLGLEFIKWFEIIKGFVIIFTIQ